MPRKKHVDPTEQVLQYFETAPLSEVEVLLRVVTRHVSARRISASEVAPPPAIVVKKRVRGPNKPKPITAADAMLSPMVRAAVAAPKRRMRASSPAPTSEATPLVPLQAESDSNPVVE